MKILIDGYNLIFQCGLHGRHAHSMALEQARDRLIRELKHRLNAETRRDITIVFDAKNRPTKEVPDDHKADGLSIVYATKHDEADSLIEDLIRKHSSPKQLLVVSSDHRIHDAARRRKATAIDSDVWFDRLERELRNSDDEDQIDDDKSELGNYNPFPPGYGEDL